MSAAEPSLLLVDEDSSEKTNIATMLKNAGFIVHEAKNGRHALAMFRKYEPVVVLCDLNNSGIEGEQLVQIIESEPADASVIVFVQRWWYERGSRGLKVRRGRLFYKTYHGYRSAGSFNQPVP